MRPNHNVLAVTAIAFAVAALGLAPASAAPALDCSGWWYPDHAEDVRGLKAMVHPDKVYTTLWRGMQNTGGIRTEHFWASIDGNTTRQDGVWIDVSNNQRDWEQCGPFYAGGNGQPVATRAVRFAHWTWVRGCSIVRGSIACTSWQHT
ncbi:hypothetical protein [Allokutzneria oryzae]|uniref:Uncharacterized protein n=1 Tax=Allokutzneria oryzae TaxID=1378989 RepID=A0ABV5ZPY3_9PSEU